MKQCLALMLMNAESIASMNYCKTKQCMITLAHYQRIALVFAAQRYSP
jgi:hypothetical protein